MIAAIRPDAWNPPLLLHVAGAMLLFGSVFVAATSVAAARAGAGATAPLTRTAFRALALGSLPAYLAMRIGAEWTASAEGGGTEAAWIGIGYGVADGGLLLGVIATVLAWRLTRRPDDPSRAASGAVLGLTTFLLLAYTVAIWAMTAKPG